MITISERYILLWNVNWLSSKSDNKYIYLFLREYVHIDGDDSNFTVDVHVTTGGRIRFVVKPKEGHTIVDKYIYQTCKRKVKITYKNGTTDSFEDDWYLDAIPLKRQGIDSFTRKTAQAKYMDEPQIPQIPHFWN